MANTIMLGNIVWNKIDTNSTIPEIQAAWKQTQEIMQANRVSLDHLKIEIPYYNSHSYFKILLKDKVKT